jgi:hypothetical protein
VDTAGVGLGGTNKVTVVVNIGATDVAFSALKVQECDTSGGSYADISGTVYGTDVNDTGSVSTLPSATDDNTIVLFTIDWSATRKRYFKIVATVGGSTATTGCYASAIAILGHEGQTPFNAATIGAAQNINA